MLEFHGGDDTTISYAGGERKGECLPSITHWILGVGVEKPIGVTQLYV